MGAGGAGRRGVPGSRLAVEAKAAEAMAVVARLMEVVMVAKGVVVTVVTREEAAKGRRRRRRWLRLKRRCPVDNCESSSRRRSAGTVSSWRTSRRLQRRAPRVVRRASISRKQAKSIVCPVNAVDARWSSLARACWGWMRARALGMRIGRGLMEGSWLRR